MRIAVLALQGAFIEHEQMLRRLGADVFEVRQLSDWLQPKDGLILPGGESTVMRKLLHDLRLFHPIREAIQSGLPVMGTCAGLILLGTEEGSINNSRDVALNSRDVACYVSTDSEPAPSPTFSTMQMAVCRNAYGRQLGSFRTVATVDGVGTDIPMTFIRAPYITRVWGSCQPLAVVDGRIVAARQDRQLALAFHPELDNDTRLHRYFLKMTQAE